MLFTHLVATIINRQMFHVEHRSHKQTNLFDKLTCLNSKKFMFHVKQAGYRNKAFRNSMEHRLWESSHNPVDKPQKKGAYSMNNSLNKLLAICG